MSVFCDPILARFINLVQLSKIQLYKIKMNLENPIRYYGRIIYRYLKQNDRTDILVLNRSQLSPKNILFIKNGNKYLIKC